jgi:hypothetical protein
MMQNRPPLLLLSSRRLSVGLTPAETIKKSPLYNLHKIKVGDTIYVDNTGRRAVYQVEKVEQQAAVGNLKADLVIYSYDDDEAKLAAIAVLANRQGFVDWVNDQAVLTTE